MDPFSSTGPVILTWDTFQRQIYERGARSVKLAAEVDQAAEELEAWSRDQSAMKKHMVDEVYRLKKEVSEHLAAARRLQMSQNAACAETDKVIAEMREASNSEKTNAKRKAKLVLERAVKSIKDYQKAVAEANKLRLLAANRLIPDLQAEFRALEESRLSILKLIFGKLNVSLSSASPSNPTWANLSKLVLDLDPVTVAASVAASSVDVSALRQLIEVVHYDPSQPEFQKSRMARIKGLDDLSTSNVSSPLASSSPMIGAATHAPAALNTSLAISGAAHSSAANSSSENHRNSTDLTREQSAHFAEVMPNSVVALGVESKREILRAQLAQLQMVILTEKRILMDLFSLVRFYGGSATAVEKAKEEYAAQKKKFQNLLGARKQVFAAMEKVGTTPSVFSTLRNRDRYAAAPELAQNSNNSNHSHLSPAVASSTQPSKTLSAPAPSLMSASAPVLNASTLPLPSGANIVKGLCLYSYKAATAKELSFRKGETLIVRDEDDSGWWYVENAAGELGFVPANFLRKLAPGENPPPPTREKKKKTPAAEPSVQV